MLLAFAMFCCCCVGFIMLFDIIAVMICRV